MPPTERRFWVVRAGSEGEDEEHVLSSGLAMIGFREASFPIPDDGKALREQLAAARSDWNRKQVGGAAGTLSRFAHEISEGDFVVLPKKGAEPIAVGTVTGPYEHREVAGELRHTRKVQWIRDDISRDKFSQDELNFLDLPPTVFQIKEHSVTERIRAEIELDLKSAPGLRRACERARATLDLDPDRVRKTAALLKKVQDASLEERATESFLIDVWTNHSVWDGGVSGAALKSALQDDEFRYRFARETTGDHASERDERIKRLSDIYNETTDRLKDVTKKKRPKIETLRTLAVFFPHDFTGVAHDAKLVALLQKMGESGSTNNIVEANRKVLDRLNDVIGPLDNSNLNQVAERMLLTVELQKLIGSTPNGPHIDEPTRERPAYTMDLGTAPDFDALKRRFEDNTKRLYFPDGLLKKLHCGLWADSRRHFAILSGLSGSGKTQLAIEYAKALTGDYRESQESPKRWQVTAVQPGWYDPGSLLGYVNPLDKENYKSTDTCKLLHQASGDLAKDLAGDPYRNPYVLILDEMNLSHPEQYFAPLLSAMEQKGGLIRFHDGEESNNDVRPQLDYPANLVIIGTVNMDETTLGISDKVLDRAFTHEFWDIKPDIWWRDNDTKLDGDILTQTKSLLKALHFTLEAARRHFGYRVIAEVNGFLERYQEEISEAPEGNTLEDTKTLAYALDDVIYAKVLPKLRGDDAEEFRTCLKDTKKVLEGHRLKNDTLELPKSKDSETSSEDANGREQEVIKLTKCKNKVEDLLKQLRDTGSATFWR